MLWWNVLLSGEGNRLVTLYASEAEYGSLHSFCGIENDRGRGKKKEIGNN